MTDTALAVPLDLPGAGFLLAGVGLLALIFGGHLRVTSEQLVAISITAYAEADAFFADGLIVAGMQRQAHATRCRRRVMERGRFDLLTASC